MKTIYYTASSLDGFLADENHSLEWLLQFGELESMKDHYPRFLGKVGAVAMGASTYRWLLDHERMLEDPSRWPYAMPTWVFSHRDLPSIPGADLRFVQGDVAAVHADMVRAAAGGDVWLCGGGDLIGQFHDAGLLDEIVVTFAPVTLGKGAPFLPRRIETPALRLVGVEKHGDVYAVLTYAVDTVPRVQPTL
ncbi:MAG: dihydrofolate reductase [Fibrobacteres bacterium]|jgi:dihydrofolate reductase|nr:dihydrofolate reductase [Fibrobacterota bacterium]